jgi:hypothetical protein
VPTVAELEFQSAVIEDVARLKGEIGYHPTRFLQMVSEYGAPDAARRLLQARDGSDGFTTLWAAGRLNMTVEAMSLLPWFEGIFTDRERAAARRRLEEHRFDVDAFAATALSNPPKWWLEQRSIGAID